MRDLVEDARLLQGERAVQQLRLDDAELAGVEAAEAADGGDLAVKIIWGHAAPQYLPLSINYLTLASISRCQPGSVLLCMGLFSRFLVRSFLGRGWVGV